MLGNLSNFIGDMLPGIMGKSLPPHFKLVQIRGDHLPITLRNFEWMLVDTSANRFSEPGIYSVGHLGNFYRVSHGRTPGKVLLTRENPIYRHCEGEADPSEIEFSGHALWLIGHEVH